MRRISPNELRMRGVFEDRTGMGEYLKRYLGAFTRVSGYPEGDVLDVEISMENGHPENSMKTRMPVLNSGDQPAIASCIRQSLESGRYQPADEIGITVKIKNSWCPLFS
ncbi:MAG: hypothetical protein JW754_02800 [Candidatus Aenigmarchaeota archaeon]|nr:hypothetical protein [Candidatus Aenigmarchaeota archaeon]